MKAKEIRDSLDPQCLSGFRKNDSFEIQRSDVILTVDNGDFVFLDCAYEELLQWAQSQEEKLRDMRERSPLPEQPDQKAIEQLLIEWIEDYHWPGRSQRA